jgi:hypothetical protein
MYLAFILNFCFLFLVLPFVSLCLCPSRSFTPARLETKWSDIQSHDVDGKSWKFSSQFWLARFFTTLLIIPICNLFTLQIIIDSSYRWNSGARDRKSRWKNANDIDIPGIMKWRTFPGRFFGCACCFCGVASIPEVVYTSVAGPVKALLENWCPTFWHASDQRLITIFPESIIWCKMYSIPIAMEHQMLSEYHCPCRFNLEGH